MFLKYGVLGFIMMTSFATNAQSLSDLYNQQNERGRAQQQNVPNNPIVNTLKNEGQKLICRQISGTRRSGGLSGSMDFNASMSNLILHNGIVYQYNEIDPSFRRTGPVTQGRYQIASNQINAEIKYGGNNLIALEVNLRTGESFMAKDGEVTKILCEVRN
jgi:hypothetical protein